jgi:hypothetical protein
VCLLVVDPRLLVRGLEHQHSREAKLLSLLIYGLARVRARELHDEYAELHQNLRGSIPSQSLVKLRARVERQSALAHRHKRRIERALEQYVSIELLLVTSPPLREELRSIANIAQADGSPHVTPQRVNREIARCTWRALTELGPPPGYLTGGRASRREYLIHTAVVGQAEILVTDDEDLALPGNATHSDPKGCRSVRPHTLHDFCQEHLPWELDFDAIDAPAVFRAARTPCSSP